MDNYVPGMDMTGVHVGDPKAEIMAIAEPMLSKHYFVLAYGLVKDLERSPERTVALRKLLESKDAAVRAAL